MSQDTEWNVRVYLDKVIKKDVQEQIKMLAYAVLGNHKLTITENKEGYDRYSYCKHDTKKYCPVGSRKLTYMGRFREYVVYGTSRTDIYLEVLKMLADSSVYFPIVSFRRDNEWVEKDVVDEHNQTINQQQEEIERLKTVIEDALSIADMEGKDKRFEPWASLEKSIK